MNCSTCGRREDFLSKMGGTMTDHCETCGRSKGACGAFLASCTCTVDSIELDDTDDGTRTQFDFESN